MVILLYKLTIGGAAVQARRDSGRMYVYTIYTYIHMYMS